MNTKSVLVGNAFPFALIRRPATVKPISPSEAQDHLAEGFASFWGHSNTAKAAKEQLGVDVTPRTARPALALDSDHFPSLDGVAYSKVLVLSPEYAKGFRPAIGEEVSADKITGWAPVLIDFCDGEYGCYPPIKP